MQTLEIKPTQPWFIVRMCTDYTAGKVRALYAAVYRYEQVPEYTALDRKAARTLVAKVRAFVEQHIKPA